MKTLLKIFGTILLFVCFTGCAGCSSSKGEQSTPAYRPSNPDKDNIGNDIDW